MLLWWCASTARLMPVLLPPQVLQVLGLQEDHGDVLMEVSAASAGAKAAQHHACLVLSTLHNDLLRLRAVQTLSTMPA